MTRFRLATRGSVLARWQADHVRTRLEQVHPGIVVDIVIVRTTGDRVTDAPLATIGGTGLFTSELDERVKAGEADAAVHSLKDVPTVPPEGLVAAAVLQREDPRDAFVPAPGRPATLAGLPAGTRVGTSSLRRRALLGALRPDIEVVDLRGNLDTRLAKLAANECDGAVLACAGIRRLGREDVIGEVLEPPEWLPAPGQGAIAVVARAGDRAAAELLAPLDHTDTHAATTAERSFLRALQGGCQVPIGALATVDGDALTLRGFVSDLTGGTQVQGERAGTVSDAAEVGRQLAADLIARGANDILAGVRRTTTGVNPP